MSIYKQANSPFWYINISRPGFPRIRESTGATDRQQALRIHDKRKAALWKLRAPIRGRTWGAAVLLWVEQEVRSTSEIYSLRKLARFFPDRGIECVDATGIDQALSAFCRTAGTYMRYRAIVHAVLNVALREGWIDTVPKLRTRLDKKPKPRSWLRRDQWDALYCALPEHQRGPADFALQTGLRRENVLGLSWDRVDIDRRLIWVEAREMKARQALGVPLNDRAVEILKAQASKPDKHKKWVFTYRGKRITSTKTGFMAACIKAGLGHYEVEGGRTKYVGFTWHGLRHTWATWHMQNGTPEHALQLLGAWRDPRMVKNYAHHSPGYLARFANNIKEKR